MTRLFTVTAMILSSFVATQNADTTVSQPETTVEESTVVDLGASSFASTLSPDDFFSNRDYRTTSDSDSPITLHFDGKTISGSGEGVEISGSTVTITQEGTYILTGNLSDGQVIVNMADDSEKAQLILDNVTMHSSTSGVIYAPSADKLFITMAEGSENTLSSVIDNEDSVDGTIFARCDLTMNGEGTLNLSVENGDGIVGKDELTITSGTYIIKSDGHGMNVNDSVAIADGTFHIQSEKDGIHSSHSSNESKGNIYILDGSFYFDVAQDGMDASGWMEINGGLFEITTNGGWESAPVQAAVPNNNQGGMGGMTTVRPTVGNTTQGQGSTGETQGEMPDRTEMQGQMQGQVPDGTETQGQMQGEMPDRTENQGQMQGEMPDRTETQGQMGGMGQLMIPEGIELPEGFDPTTATAEEIAEIMAQLDPDFLIPSGGQPTAQENITVETTEESTSSTKGLKSAGTMRLYGGTFDLDCYDDAIHSDSRVEIHGGNYQIGTADDAIHANWETVITGGNIQIINCFEGIEGQRIEISGGIIDMYCGDDGINAASTSPDPEDSSISLVISGGTISMNTNAEGDGLDSNGSILITGGDILISSTTDQRDTSLDSSGTSLITGGSFIATGSNSGTIQNFNTGSTQGSILVVLSAVNDGLVTLKDSNGLVLVEFQPAKAYQAVAISIPELTVGETYVLTAGEYSETIELSSLQYGSGSERR